MSHLNFTLSLSDRISGKRKWGSIIRILMAEDEVALAKAVGRILERNNYSVDIVHDGIDIFNCLYGTIPSLLLKSRICPISLSGFIVWILPEAPRPAATASVFPLQKQLYLLIMERSLPLHRMAGLYRSMCSCPYN